MIAFGFVAMIIGIVQKEFFMIPGALVLIGLMAFLLYYYGRGNSIRNEYNDIVMRYGKDELVRQMTSDKATVFYLNKNDPQSYVIGTEEYLILAYDNIYPWESIDCVNIRKHVFTQQEINYSYDQEGRDRMTYEALHDPSTGLYNSSGFDILLYDADRKHSTLVLVDISNYEDISRNEGPESADRTVRGVAEVLRNNFRASDFVCRLGVHRFAVILTRANINEKDVISEKVKGLQTAYDELGEGSPDAVLRFGIAFGSRDDINRDMMEEAEKALEGDSL